jgi:hypothetical protein
MSTAPEIADLAELEGDERTGLRILADWLLSREQVDVGRLVRELAHEGLTRADVGQLLGDAVSRDDDCPDCPRGTVITAGPMERDTGHVPGRCDAGCGYLA